MALLVSKGPRRPSTWCKSPRPLRTNQGRAAEEPCGRQPGHSQSSGSRTVQSFLFPAPLWTLLCWKALLGSLLFLATLVTACNAVCSLESRKGLPNQPPGECVDPDGGKHPINSFWVKDCNRCFCGQDTISCCSQVATPVNFDKEKCQQVFHPENCTYSVVEKENPGKFCLVENWVL